MGVMAAGMHSARILRGVGYTAHFFDGQSVHVRTDGHCFAGSAALDVREDSGAGHLPPLNAVFRQPFQNIGRRLRLLKAQFRALVEMLVGFFHLRQIGLNVLHSDHRMFLLF